jgi:cobalt-zinc-cadmium efflux system membrane fusion protein
LVLHGTVQDISDAVDPVTLTLKVRVVLANPEYRLKPDMFANMSLTTGTRDVIVVPATAVIRDGNDSYVFVESSPGKYDRREITLGGSESGTDEVTKGLRDGDQVVTTGAELLRESGVR